MIVVSKYYSELMDFTVVLKQSVCTLRDCKSSNSRSLNSLFTEVIFV